MKSLTIIALFVVLTACPRLAGAQTPSIRVGVFDQDVRTFYTTEHGLPSNDVFALAVGSDGSVFAGTGQGLARLDGDAWTAVAGFEGSPVRILGTDVQGSLYVVKDGILFRGDGTHVAEVPEQVNVLCARDVLFLGTDSGLFTVSAHGRVTRERRLIERLGENKAVHDIAVGPEGELVVAAAAGAFQREGRRWRPFAPREGARSWLPVDVRAVAFDRSGTLWVASPSGVAELGDATRLYTGQEGLPYNDFTSIATGPDGALWLGTHRGAIRYDGQRWAYRQGLRWLPGDDVRDVLVTPDRRAWFATSEGVAVIEAKPMTLAEKARFYEDEIDKYHRRTEYEYVLEVGLPEPGVKRDVHKHDSDNDGLWTSMYGAGECFAYAATGDPAAKARAKKTFEALRFLGEVTQGGSNPAPPGFVARTILPTSGRNPNDHDTPEHDRDKQKGDAYWKVIVPRWPTSKDGKWYWKTDTSSDELDGHYFFYAQYYDLVADTEEEKARVRDHVRALTDNLVDHDFCLVDHDGKPTRWAVFSPKALNEDPYWFMERGLNCLSILSYLAVAEHITGDPKYRAAADTLIEDHHYAQNLLVPKIQNGPGTGNQSDDEMAFMGYYNLLKYEKNPQLRSLYALSFYRYWRMEEPEASSFFNFAFAGQCFGEEFANAFGSYSLFPTNNDWLEAAVAELKRFPLDRCNWRHTNSHRTDIVMLPPQASLFDGPPRGKGYRVDGKVIPVDERFFNHWNHDPWELDVGGNGAELADGAVFLLPYYMGLYHGFIVEE